MLSGLPTHWIGCAQTEKTGENLLKGIFSMYESLLLSLKLFQLMAHLHRELANSMCSPS